MFAVAARLPSHPHLARRRAKASPSPCHLAPPCSLAAWPLLGSLTEAETGAPLVLPLTEHAALLAFLLALQGSRPSLRKRRFTFQADPSAAAAAVPTPEQRQEAAAAARAGRLAGPSAAAAEVPLASGVFAEAPNPHALTDGAAAVAVLLPGELGLPTDAFAGSDVLQVCHCVGYTTQCCFASVNAA